MDETSRKFWIENGERYLSGSFQKVKNSKGGEMTIKECLEQVKSDAPGISLKNLKTSDRPIRRIEEWCRVWSKFETGYEAVVDRSGSRWLWKIRNVMTGEVLFMEAGR